MVHLTKDVHENTQESLIELWACRSYQVSKGSPYLSSDFVAMNVSYIHQLNIASESSRGTFDLNQLLDYG